MNKTELRERIVIALKKYSDSPDIFEGNIDDTFELVRGLKVKSTRVVDFVLDIESELDIEIDPDEMDNMFTLGETVETILRILNNTEN